MPKAALYNIEGQQVGEVELPASVFAVEINQGAIKQVVNMQLANRRRGTASTKGRGEVRGGGRKPWRQKGTGRARHGSIRSPIWRGGAITFGPKPRDYTIRVPKKVRRLALRSALTAKVAAGKLLVVEELPFDVPKTKRMVEILGNLNVVGKALLVTGEADAMVAKSSRNIPGVKSLPATALNVYDLLLHGQLILTKDAVAKVEEVLG